MPNENEEVVIAEEVEEEADAPEPQEPTDDVATLKARLQRLEEKAIAQRERTKIMRQELQKLKPKAETPKAEVPKTGELDDNALDYLDLKGITEQEDIDDIQRVIARTGMTVRQALKDDYLASKLERNKAKRDVANATPSSTKRGGNQQGDLAGAIARFEQDGTLPDDFDTRSAIINAIEARSNVSIPGFKRH